VSLLILFLSQFSQTKPHLGFGLIVRLYSGVGCRFGSGNTLRCASAARFSVHFPRQTHLRGITDRYSAVDSGRSPRGAPTTGRPALALSLSLTDTCRMPEHDPTRTDRLALYMWARAAKQAAHDEAVAVVGRWNAALAAGRGALWSPTIRCAIAAGMPWLDVYCSGCRTSRAIDVRTIG
jgi:hypothetical protein